MKIAVISDIHANWPALMAVKDDWVSQGAEQVWCLGDIIGYGADPWECWKEIAGLGALVIKGNHEEALSNEDELKKFNDRAQAGIIHARQLLDVLGLANPCLSLPYELEVEEHGVGLAHGGFEQPELFGYTTEKYEVRFQLAYYAPGLINFVGHSHRSLFASIPVSNPNILADWRTSLDWLFDESEDDKLEFKEIALRADRSYLINPGSVGQPRDHDPRASYGLLEITAEKKSFIFRRVHYDIDVAAKRIREAGLPESLAERLYHGN